MKIKKTDIPGLLVIEPTVFKDQRGFFYETYYASRYKELGIHKAFVQDNLSRSKKGTLRGLHYQLQQPQGKLVSVTRGRVLDVALDIRKGSPTFGKSLALELSDENHLQFYIPEGFAHGFYVLSEEADFYYKCTDYYHPQSEQGILWNDPELGINWNIDAVPLLSQKDQLFPLLKNVDTSCLPVFED